MRTLYTLFFCCLSVWGVAQKGGMQFANDSWENILAYAQEQEKLIFLDAYTSWCAPCKKMAKEVFPLDTVGTFFNKHFINVKMDMEKGEGLRIADQYNVVVYPTLLFLSGDGTLVHRVAGYHNEEQFLALGNTALDPSKNLAAMEHRYASGDTSPDFLRNYTKLRWEVMDGTHTEVATAYMKTQSDWNTPQNRAFIFTFCEDTDSEMFAHLTDHRDAYIQQFGQKEVSGKIQNLVYNTLQTKENLTLDEVHTVYTKAYPGRADQLTSHYRMTYYRNRGDRDGFATSALDHYAKYPSDDPNELNDVAWTFYEAIENQEYLKGAVKLAKQAVRLDKNYYNMDTLAALYKKIGKRGKALRTAKKAIKLAKRNNEDYSATEDLIKEIKAM